MKNKLLPLLIVIGAFAALAGTVSYAVARATGVGGANLGSMMNGGGYSMMDGGDGHRTAWYPNGSGPVADIAAARAQAQRFADRLGLKTGEVMRFAKNFYVRLTDKQGKPATEVLVDPQTGAVTLEYGPAMMWNGRYGMMGRASSNGSNGMMGSSGAGMMSATNGTSDMMGSYGGDPSWTPGNVSGPVNATRAQALANRWLAQQGTGLTTAEPDALPGYYTFDTLENGKIAGMLSVNKQTGAVWYHWWHGGFLSTAE